MKVITFGEIMLRLATPGHQRFSQAASFNASFGGGEANVAVSLANYGIETEYITRLPRNDLGEAVLYGAEKAQCRDEAYTEGRRQARYLFP